MAGGGMTQSKTFYFHGAPGSPRELDLFGPRPSAWSSPDRFLQRPELSFEPYVEALARDVEAEADGAPLRLVGFSAGARIALELAARLPGSVKRVELISPAAPFELGDFLPRMEGRPVFNLARSAPALLGPMCWWMTRVVDPLQPRALFDIAFSRPAGADADLASDPVFAAAAAGLLRRAMGPGAKGYRREILACVRPWRVDLSAITAPLRIWQGTVDNWTPPDMAAALHAELPSAEPLTLQDGLSHYSTLRCALGVIGQAEA